MRRLGFARRESLDLDLYALAFDGLDGRCIFATFAIKQSDDGAGLQA